MCMQHGLELVCMFFKELSIKSKSCRISLLRDFLPVSPKSELSPRNVSAQGRLFLIQFIAYNHN